MFGVDRAEFAANTALWEDEKAVSYGELAEKAGDIARHIGRRTLVFVLTANTAASVAGYVGLINTRIVPLLLDAKIKKALLQNLIAAYRPEYVWAPEGRAEDLEEFSAVYAADGYVLFRSADGGCFPLHDDLCLLISTSGSTGSPKLVRQTYRNIEANAASIIEYLRITEKERAITSLPMNYVYGLSVVNTHLQAGASLILTDRNSYTKGFWDVFRQYGGTSFAGVPFMYEMLDKLGMFRNDIEGLKTFTQAGGKLNADLQEKLTRYAAEYGKEFIVMYGASEATARMAYLPMESALAKKGSIGIPIPGGRFELINADGSVISEPDQAGELVYYGDNVTYGYATEGEDLAKGDENRGRLATGDMAKMDADGFFYIVGRMKRFIKMVGNRLNLDDIDALLKKQFDTLEIVSAGKDDFLDVFVTDEGIVSGVYSYLFSMLKINQKLMKVYVVKKIPRSLSGKILYSELEGLKDGAE